MYIEKLDGIESFDKGMYFANILKKELSTSKSFANDEKFQNNAVYLVPAFLKHSHLVQ